ncbi:YbhB/YbcL family Raf kinase inhibitor-like protein [Desulfobacula sp.]|uniref:YbhB/YbcL family Raf kinase inhibitor-like protein n=1 Tax=Desulfobacula sp. TaxID=2593537 RepID=UPI002622A29C|nr:YbhB/YbcL family Raf kinase inhibitor-like protein [Desulfobacula sp.]
MGFAPSAMQLKSDVFEQDGLIPSKFTGEGADISPSLSWTDPPQDAKAFAVICHDPDAPLVTSDGTYGFVHWVLYNIPGNITRLDEDTKQYTSGRNDAGQMGYNGPMPPNGHGVHNYYFWVLALKEPVELEAGLTLWQLLKKIEPQLIGMNRLVGRYKRD